MQSTIYIPKYQGNQSCYPVDRDLPMYLTGVAQNLDNNTIHGINHYPAISVRETDCIIQRMVIYPVDSVIHLLKNWGQVDAIIQLLTNRAQITLGGLWRQP